MRKAIAFAALTGMLVAGDLFAAAADDLLARGQAAFRAGQYEQSVGDLTAAADSFIAEAQTEFGSNTVSAVLLDRYETALVYLTVAYARTNRESEALEAIVRIAASERVEPRYALLELGPDVAEFAELAARLAPGQLPVNNALARQTSPAVTAAAATTPPPVEDTSAPLPSVIPKSIAPPEPEPVITTATAEVPAPAPQPAPPAEPQPCDCPQTTVPDLEQQLAAQRAADQKVADERVAAVQRDAEARIAAIQAAAAATAREPMPMTVPRAATQPQPQATIRPQPVISSASEAESLRQADDFVTRGDVTAASAVWERLLASTGTSRDALAQVAAGFYRVGAYDRARYAFSRVGELKRGEEDLRFYKAVSLFETGDYYDAKKEMSCALPYIEVTDDVAHYREMIDEMAQASGQRAASLE